MTPKRLMPLAMLKYGGLPRPHFSDHWVAFKFICLAGILSKRLEMLRRSRLSPEILPALLTSIGAHDRHVEVLKAPHQSMITQSGVEDQMGQIRRLNPPFRISVWISNVISMLQASLSVGKSKDTARGDSWSICGHLKFA
jgi:hypothetical protein